MDKNTVSAIDKKIGEAIIREKIQVGVLNKLFSEKPAAVAKVNAGENLTITPIKPKIMCGM